MSTSLCDVPALLAAFAQNRHIPSSHSRALAQSALLGTSESIMQQLNPHLQDDLALCAAFPSSVAFTREDFLGVSPRQCAESLKELVTKSLRCDGNTSEPRYYLHDVMRSVLESRTKEVVLLNLREQVHAYYISILEKAEKLFWSPTKWKGPFVCLTRPRLASLQ